MTKQPAKVSTGIQCDRLNESDVTEESPDVNVAKGDATENAVKNGDDLPCDIEDVDDAVDDEWDFDIIEEETGYNQAFAEDENYNPDTNQATETETETETVTDGEESSPTKRPRLQDDNLRVESKHIVFFFQASPSILVLSCLQGRRAPN